MLVGRRDAIVKSSTALKNQLHTHLVYHYPSYRKFFYVFDCKSALVLWEKYPSPSRLSGVTAEKGGNNMRLYYLLQRAQRGDEGAVANIYLKFNPIIRKLSRNLSYEEAETDLIIAFLETIREIKIDKFHIKSDGAVINYIYTFLKNESINLFKKNILQKNILQRVVLKKKVIQGFSDKEISQLLDVSRQVVNRVKNRGLMNLRKILNLKKEGAGWKKRCSS
jgi:hypothetical protein